MSEIPGLSDTIFKGAATDKLIAVEANDVKGSEKVINAFKSTRGVARGVASKITGALNSGKVKDLLKYVDRNTGEIKVDKVLADATTMYGKFASGALDKLNPGVKESLAKIGINSENLASGELLNEISLIIDGSKHAIQDLKDIKDAQSLVNFIQRTVGSDHLITLFDASEQAQAFGAMIQLAVEMGIPELTDIMIDKIQSEEGKVVAWARVALEAINSSDMPLLARALENVTTRSLRALVDDPVRRLLYNFNIRSESYDDEYVALIANLEKLDDKWNVTQVGGVEYPNLTVYANCSEDAMTILGSNELHRPFISTSKLVNRRSVNEVIRSTYSSFPILNY